VFSRAEAQCEDRFSVVRHGKMKNDGRLFASIKWASFGLHFVPKVWNRNVERAPGKSGWPLKDAEPCS